PRKLPVIIVNRPAESSPQIAEGLTLKPGRLAQDRNALAAGVVEYLFPRRRLDAGKVRDLSHRRRIHADDRRRGDGRLQTLVRRLGDRRAIALAALDDLQRLAHHGVGIALPGRISEDVRTHIEQQSALCRETRKYALPLRRFAPPEHRKRVGG